MSNMACRLCQNEFFRDSCIYSYGDEGFSWRRTVFAATILRSDDSILERRFFFRDICTLCPLPQSVEERPWRQPRAGDASIPELSSIYINTCSSKEGASGYRHHRERERDTSVGRSAPYMNIK